MSARRIAGIAALAYVAGASIENMEVLRAPTLDSSVGEIRDNYADHAFAVVTSTAGVLALVAYAAFAAALVVWLRGRDRAGEPWPTIALLGGIAGPLLAAVGLIATAPLVAGSDAAADDGVADALFDVYLLSRLVAGGFTALFLAGIGVSALRSGALPRPLPELAIAIAVALLLAPIAAFEQVHGLALAAAIAYAAQSLWILLAGMWLLLADGAGPLALLRRGAFLLLAIAAGLIGIALVAVPGASGEFFSWVLRPEPLAAFAGGVYIGSATAYALALPRSARQVRGLVAGAVVLSVSVLIITLTHTDQFDFDRLQAVIWVVLFAGFSAVTIALLAFDRGEDEASAGEPLSGRVRGVLGTVAIGGGALALALWIDPGGLSGPSPFELPPLGGRFAGSWVALLAVVCGWAALRNRVDEAIPASLLAICLPAGALLAALRTIDRLEPAGAAAAYIAALLAIAIAGLAAHRELASPAREGPPPRGRRPPGPGTDR